MENWMRRHDMKYTVSFLILLTLLLFPILTAESSEEPTALQETSEIQHYTDTQNNVPVDAHVYPIRENVLKVEFISQSPGMVKLKEVQLISPDGASYKPSKTFDITEETARKLGRFPLQQEEKKPQASTPAAKAAPSLFGAALGVLSNVSVSSGTDSCPTGTFGSSRSGVSGLGIARSVAPAVFRAVHDDDEDDEKAKSRATETGVFSSVAEFFCPPTTQAAPWNLKAQMQQRDGSSSTYTFFLQPALFVGSAKPPIPPTSELLLSPTIQGQPCIIVFFDPPPGLQKVVFYQDEPAGHQRIATALKPVLATGLCLDGGGSTEIWQVSWVAPKKPSVKISAHGFVDGKEIPLVSKTFTLDPRVEIRIPSFAQCVETGPIPVEAYVPQGSHVTVDALPAAPYTNYFKEGGVVLGIQAKGLPALDEHEVGGSLTDDTGYDESRTSGDNSCIPTVVASSLMWFDKNGYDKLVPEGTSAKDLVENLGNKSGINRRTGTSPAKMEKGIKDYLREKGLENDFEVKAVNSPTLENIAEEFAKGEDVTLGYFHDRYGQKNADGSTKLLGHFVAVDGMSDPDANGARKARIMNPRNGQHEEITINKDGTITGGDKDASLVKGAMLFISPKKKVGRTLPLKSKSYASGKVCGTVDLSVLSAGHYLLRLTVTDKTATYTDFQSIYVGTCPSQEGSGKAKAVQTQAAGSVVYSK